MNSPTYTLRFYGPDRNEILLEWDDLDTMPRFEKGDQFRAIIFDGHADTGQRYTVVDVLFSVSSADDPHEITQVVILRPETIFEEGKRESAEKEQYAPKNMGI